MKERFNSLIEKDEVLAKNGQLTIEEIVSAIASVKNFAELGSISEAEKEDYINKFTSVAATAGISEKAINDAVVKSENDARNVKVEATKLENMKKRGVGRVAAIAAAIGVTIGAAGAFAACNKEEEPVVEVTQEAPKEVEKTTMDAEYLEDAKVIETMIESDMELGMPEDFQITEENKTIMVEKYVNAYYADKMNELTDEQVANLYYNTPYVVDDLLNARSDVHNIAQQRAISINEHMDYSVLFNEQDTKLLNESADLFNTAKANKDNASKQAFAEYMRSQFMNTNIASQYSQYALDMTRDVYFEGFERVFPNTIDDELYQAINSVTSCENEENTLDVVDKTVTSVQTNNNLYIKDKIETRLENAKDYAESHEDKINENNNVTNIIETISASLDLSNEKTLPNFDDVINSYRLTDDGKGKSVHDSGITDEQGGIISNDPNGGIRDDETREQYEDRIEDETEQKSEETKTITDENNNVIGETGKNDKEQGAKDGYYDGNNNIPKRDLTGKSKEYIDAYNEQYAIGKADREALDKQLEEQLKQETTTEFQDTKDEVVDQQTVVETQDYLTKTDNTANADVIATSNVVDQTSNEQVTNAMQEFISVEESGEEVVSESEVTEETYTYDPSADIAALEALKTSLLSEVTYTEDSTKTL